MDASGKRKRGKQAAEGEAVVAPAWKPTRRPTYVQMISEALNDKPRGLRLKEISDYIVDKYPHKIPPSGEKMVERVVTSQLSIMENNGILVMMTTESGQKYEDVKYCLKSLSEREITRAVHRDLGRRMSPRIMNRVTESVQSNLVKTILLSTSTSTSSDGNGKSTAESAPPAKLASVPIESTDSHAKAPIRHSIQSLAAAAEAAGSSPFTRGKMTASLNIPSAVRQRLSTFLFCPDTPSIDAKFPKNAPASFTELTSKTIPTRSKRRNSDSSLSRG